MAAPVFRLNSTLRGRVLFPPPVEWHLRCHKTIGNLASAYFATARHHRALLATKTIDADRLTASPLQRTCHARSRVKWPPREGRWHQLRKFAARPDPRPEDEASSHAPSPPNGPPSKSVSLPSSITPKLLSRPHEYIWTIPNILTFSRLASAPLIGYFILTTQPVYALSLFAYAAVTDGLDGYIARHFNQKTVVGTVIDPMADKALMTISVVALAIQNIIPPWLAVIILGRDVALSFTAFYYRWISLPPPKTMARYWDFSLPSAEVRPTEISKWNTFLQLLLVGAGMTMPVLPEAVIAAWHLNQGFEVYQYIVAGTTVWSGASYLYSKDAVKILTQEEIDQRMKEKEAKEKETSNGQKEP